MRTLVLSMMFVAAISTSAQQTGPQAGTPPPVSSNWQRLEALPPGTSINVKALDRHLGCKIRSVDADTLTCTHGKDAVFQRTEILNVKVHQRGRSTLIALGIGAGFGGIFGAATSGCSDTERNSWFGCFLTPTRPQGAAIGAVFFGLVAMPVGYFTDFARTTVYKGP